MRQRFETHSHVPRQPEATPTTIWADVPELELVRLAKIGNAAAFEELVGRSASLGLRVATGILKNREDARDEVQNAFWLAYSRIELFACDSKFSTWLVRIVINSCYMRLRTLRRLPMVSIDREPDWGNPFPYEPVTRHTPEMELGTREVRQLLRRELKHIPTLLREPVEMHYIKGLPLKDIAKELGVTVAAAKSRLHRAQIYLRDRMIRHISSRGPGSLTAN